MWLTTPLRVARRHRPVLATVPELHRRQARSLAPDAIHEVVHV